MARSPVPFAWFASLVLALACAGVRDLHASARSDAFVVRGVRLFDGRVMHADPIDVLVRDGVIAAIGNDVDADDAAEIDGAGRTLLPGLIDAHVHVFGDALRGTLRCGVTTVLDMFTHPNLARLYRRNDDPALADLRSAGMLATAAGGHGTQFGIDVPTLAAPDEAAAFVAARIAEGSDYIKLVYDDGGGWGGRIPTLSRATLKAVIDAAHAHGLLAVVHIHDLERAREALEDGADGLVHLFLDPVDEEFVELAQRSRAFITPTLAIIESVCGVAGGADLADDEHLAPLLSASDRAGLRRTIGSAARRNPDYAIVRENARRLHAAGVPLLAGSDAPNPGTAHGASMHREVVLLVEAGLKPQQALAAATSVPARVFGLTDRGTIEPGQRADLLLVDGDPSQDVLATRRIVHVWKAGRVVPEPAPSDAAALAAGLLSDFDGDLAARTGTSWAVSTDSIAGGKSEASVERSASGAGDSSGAMTVRGVVRTGFAFPWAGAMLQPGPAPMAPVDLSSCERIVFHARGDGATYRVMFLSARGGIPPSHTFVAGEEWERVELDFEDFAGLDAKAIAGIVFTAGPGAGAFEFHVDDVALE